LIVGREADVGRLRSFVEAEGTSRALVLSGEPGMGRTTLWEAGIGIASGMGLLVLAVRASQAETQLTFAGLADLLDGIDVSTLTGLPVPQRHALEVALRRVTPIGPAPEPLAIRRVPGGPAFAGRRRDGADRRR
jgi:DNA polymerase III delta prime subunit